jgi:hypothetical protein
MPDGQVRTETRDVPMLTLRAAVQAATFDAEARTVELVWTTGAKGERRQYSWDDGVYRYYEELEVSDKAVRMDRLNNGAPLLASHSSWSLSSVIGVVERAWIKDGEGHALVRFSEREEFAGIVRDIQSGILRNVSVGYNVHKYERTEAAKKGELDTMRAVDWEPMEISIVPIGFDDGAKVRAEEPQKASKVQIITRGGAATVEETGMTPEEIAAQAAAAAEAKRQAEIKAAAEAATVAERGRVTEIRSAVTRAGLDASLADRLIAESVTLDAARAQIIDAVAARQTEQQPNTRSQHRIEMTGHEAEQRREAIANAIAHRADPNVQLTEHGRQFRGLNLIDMGRDAIEAAGGKPRGLTAREVAIASMNLDSNLCARAGMHSTSDFPIILGNTVNRTLRAAYDVAAPTFRPWTRRATAKDFREIIRAQIGDVSKLDLVLEGGEYKYGTIGEGSEKYKVAKYGKIIALTWETLVNDDLDAFSRIPASFGQAAAQLESDIVYGILTANANLADGGALFNTTALTTAGGHANLAASGGAIDLTTLGTARAAMLKQKSAGDGKAKGNGYALNVMPKFLVVGPDYAQLAYQYTSSAYVPTSAAGVQIPQNVALQVIVDGRLTGNQWYLIADPAVVDTIEYAYLEGEEGIFTETRQGFEVDGVEIKVRHVFGAKAIDFRGMYKNAGA